MNAPRWTAIWRLYFGIATCGLLLALFLVLQEQGVFADKLPETTLVILYVNESDPDVYVDGEQRNVTWRDGGKSTEFEIKFDEIRKVQVRKEGFKVVAQAVYDLYGGGKIFMITLDQGTDQNNEE